MGVDIITANINFINQKKVKIKTDNDTLIAPKYLLSFDKTNIFQDDNSFDYMTIDQLIIDDKWEKLPNNIGIIGNDITAIYLAYSLKQLDKNISLFSSNKYLMPHEDEDISWQLQLYLEAQGIKIYLSQNLDKNNISLIKKKCDRLIVTDVNSYQINDYLGLSKLGIKINSQGIEVNSKLQTDNPQFYACGDILGGYHIDNISKHEAQIAVKNALFIPWTNIDYSKIPYCLNTSPRICRIGYTEKQARLLWGNTIKIISLFPLRRSLLFDYDHNDIYYLKIILDRNNYIIGFHSLGIAEEIFTAISLMIQNNQPLKYLFKLNFIKSSSYKLIKEIKQIWQEKNKLINSMMMSVAETFFIWKNDKI